MRARSGDTPGVLPSLRPLPGYRAPAVAAVPQPTRDLESAAAAESVDRLVAEAMSGGVPGAAVAVVKDGVELVKGYGVASTATRQPVDPATTRFRAGSVSKLVVWTALMQAVERGRFGVAGLDADIAPFCRPLRIPATFAEPVRVWNLFTHTTGFDDNQLGYLFKREPDPRSLAEALAAHQPARVRPPATDPAAAHLAGYCSWAASLAAHMVATVNQTDFDGYCEREIFTPLGMTETTYREPAPGAVPPNWAAGHAPGAAGMQPQPFEYLHTLAPDGGLSTTARDMARFMLAHLAGGELEGRRILGEPGVARLHARSLAAHEALDGATLGFCEAHRNGRRFLVHAGRTIHFFSLLLMEPRERFGMFIALNARPRLEHERMVGGIADAFFPASPAAIVTGQTQTSAARHAGTYASRNHAVRTIEKALLLVDPAAVTVVAGATDGELVLGNFAGPSSRWRPVPGEADVFQKVEAGAPTQELIGFVTAGSSRHLVHSMAFAPAYRMRRWQTPAFHRVVLRISGATLVSTCAVGIAASIQVKGAQLPAWMLATLLAATDLIALAVIWRTLADPYPLLYEFPRRLRLAVGALAWAAVPLTAACTMIACAAVVTGLMPPLLTAGYGAFALAAVTFLASAHHWNLVGARFA